MNKIGIHYAYWGDEWIVDLKERIQLARNIGFDVLEVTPPPFMTDLEAAPMAELRKFAADAAMELSFCIGFPREKDMASPDPDIRQAGIEHTLRMIEAVHRMGGTILSGILYSSWPFAYDRLLSPADKRAAWQRGVESVRRVIPLAEDYGIEYAIEMVNRFEQYIVNTVEEGKAFCQDIGSPNAKLLMDVFHANIEENNIGDAIRSAGPLLSHIHISENNRRLPGFGRHIPWTEIFQALREIDYPGRIILEPFIAPGGPVGNDLRIWHDGEADLSRDARNEYARQSLAFVRQSLLKAQEA
jgi:D-psicose/D-tagatose/L-ribulose 3-epimerase